MAREKNSIDSACPRGHHVGDIDDRRRAAQGGMEADAADEGGSMRPGNSGDGHPSILKQPDDVSSYHTGRAGDGHRRARCWSIVIRRLSCRVGLAAYVLAVVHHGGSIAPV